MSKKFKDTTVGQILFGAASAINPTLGSVLQGVTSPKEAIEAITIVARKDKDKDKARGKIFILPIEECVRIRTGETGSTAIG